MTDYTNKVIMIYNDDGVPTATVEYPWPDGTVEMYETLPINFTITDIKDVSSAYVANGVAMVRPQASWTYPQSAVPVGQSFVISNLPVGAKVTLGTETYVVDDGTFEFESLIADAFPFSVEAWPYMSTKGTMVFA